MELFLEKHSPELLILILTVLVLGVLVPQLVAIYRHSLEIHPEHMRVLEQGQTLLPPDDRSRSAGRTAVLVPMVVICAAATVTCFLVAYQHENVSSVVILAVWSVAGVVSLAAITGGVALMGRLAQLNDEEPEEEPGDLVEK